MNIVDEIMAEKDAEIAALKKELADSQSDVAKLLTTVEDQRQYIERLKVQVEQLKVDYAAEIARLRNQLLRRQLVGAFLEERIDAFLNGRLPSLDEYERVGNAIMECATGKPGPLSDSDVCGVINDLRAQVAELKADGADLENGKGQGVICGKETCRSFIHGEY